MTNGTILKATMAPLNCNVTARITIWPQWRFNGDKGDPLRIHWRPMVRMMPLDCNGLNCDNLLAQMATMVIFWHDWRQLWSFGTNGDNGDLLAQMVTMVIFCHKWRQWWSIGNNDDPLAEMASLATVVQMDRQLCNWCQWWQWQKQCQWWRWY